MMDTQQRCMPSAMLTVGLRVVTHGLLWGGVIGPLSGLLISQWLVSVAGISGWMTGDPIPSMFYTNGAVLGLTAGVALGGLAGPFMGRKPILRSWRKLAISSLLPSTLLAMAGGEALVIAWIAGSFGFVIGFVCIMFFDIADARD